MPMIATTASGERVTARTASSEGAYKCPNCGSDMSVAGGEATQYKKHFRHTGESCHDYRSGKETEAHLNGKNNIADELRSSSGISSVNVEHETEGGIPDVHFTAGGVAYSVELQVSHISLRDLRRRTKERTADGMCTVWMFHSQHYDTRKTSRNGNEYVEFKTGEMAYIETVFGESVPDDVWVLYYDPESTEIGTAHKISLFDDGGGGWVVATRPFSSVSSAVLQSGLKIGAPDFAAPESQGDVNQARLF